jgi:2-dehydro-3-deoxyphosphogluconate aldolase/(4S)-4-hydroxy-2-oxoglutarate aldolase
MESKSWLPIVCQSQVIAVIRTMDFQLGLPMARAVVAGGMRLVEITWNSDRAADLIDQLRQEIPDCLIGAGTLLTLEDMRRAIAAGAQFLFTPHVETLLIRAAVEQDMPIVAGALTPTEIVQAWQAGATCVKVFPVHALGGASYIRSLQGPLGQIPLIPTGGITIENTSAFLQAGAVAVGLSGDLFPAQVVQRRQWNRISERTRQLLETLDRPTPTGTAWNETTKP